MIETLFSFSKTSPEESVGVEIGYDRLRLVRISRSSGHPTLSDYAVVPFEEGTSKYSPEFSQALKSALKAFCGSSKNRIIWTACSMDRSDIRYLKIPNVSENQISNAVYWTYKKETSFNENEYVFTFQVPENQKKDNKKDNKIEVVVCTALKYDIERLKLLFTEIGFPLTGISLYPFAVQNLFKNKWLESENSSICTLWIGKTRSRIDVFFPDGSLAMSRNIKTSERSMTDAVREKVTRERYELRAAAPMLFEGLLSGNLPLNLEGAEPFDENALFKMIQNAADRLIRQMERTFDYYNINICETPVSKIYVAGNSARHKPLVEYIGSQIGENSETGDMNPFASVEAVGRLKKTPESDAERLSFVPAVGLALSDNAFTPNFLMTYPDREKFEKIFFVRRIVLAILMLAAVICGGVYHWQGRLMSDKEKYATMLTRESEKIMLAENNEIAEKLRSLEIPFKQENHRIVLSEDMTALLSARINTQKQKLRDCAERYSEIAAISDIIRLMPKELRLSGITAARGQKNNPNNSKPEAEKTMLTIEGIVRGRSAEFETVLNKYLTDLGGSPLLAKPTIAKKIPELFEEQEVLQFNIQSELNRN